MDCQLQTMVPILSHRSPQIGIHAIYGCHFEGLDLLFDQENLIYTERSLVQELDYATLERSRLHQPEACGQWCSRVPIYGYVCSFHVEVIPFHLRLTKKAKLPHKECQYQIKTSLRVTRKLMCNERFFRQVDAVVPILSWKCGVVLWKVQSPGLGKHERKGNNVHFWTSVEILFSGQAWCHQTAYGAIWSRAILLHIFPRPTIDYLCTSLGRVNWQLLCFNIGACFSDDGTQ